MNPTVPSASGWSSGNTPLPWKVVATGMLSACAKRIRASLAPALAAPWPASTTGLRASRRICAARETCSAEGSSARGTFTRSGASGGGASASSTSSGTARYTAPGRSVCASLNALRIISGAAPGMAISADHLVTGANIGTRSTPWCDSLKLRCMPTWADSAISGVELVVASAVPSSRLIAPGPSVAEHTPAFPVSRP